MCKTVNIAHLKGIKASSYMEERERERGYKVKCNYLPYLIYTSTTVLQLTQEDLLNERKEKKEKKAKTVQKDSHWSKGPSWEYRFLC
jgi:hypothetical protein